MPNVQCQNAKCRMPNAKMIYALISVIRLGDLLQLRGHHCSTRLAKIVQRQIRPTVERQAVKLMTFVLVTFEQTT